MPTDPHPPPDLTQATWDATAAGFGGPAPLSDRGLPARYTDRGLIGRGGNGEVRRVYDAVLDRELAMKLLLPGREQSEEQLARLRQEAAITAGLQHPGIVPVHDLGQLDDGQVWFTMKEIRGQTLDQAIRGLERGEWTLRALLGRLLLACQAVAFAHSRGVAHLDLKPANLMLGEFGEVLVMDWGLARSLSVDDELQVEGRVEGTPVYMAPEQARGEPAGFAADVYALGAVLYTLLSGRPPYLARGKAALSALLAGAPRRLQAEDGVPPKLIAVCEAAMARAPEDRCEVRDLLDGLQGWLDGVQRRERALGVVAEADALWPAIAARRARAAALRAQAEERLRALPPSAPLEEKEPGWALQDAAAEEERQARLDELLWHQTLRAALNLVDDLPEAHARLADHYRGGLEEAERRRDAEAVSSNTWLLRQHDRGQHAAWLTGTGALSLVTDPPGAEVRLYRYVERRRRLVAEPVGTLGRTPLQAVPLDPGSYLLTLHREGHAVVRYPVFIERQAHWTGIPPGEGEPFPIALPRALPDHLCYVPAGPFIAGGDPIAGDALPRQWVWVDGFVISRFPVTHAEYLFYLNDLLGQGREEEAERHQPRVGSDVARGAPLYRREADGRFGLPDARDSLAVQPSWPVTRIPWPAALALADWQAARDGLPWRLPVELEREKAARGVDARLYPWGDLFDDGFARTARSRVGTPTPTDVRDFPADISPYEVRGLAGNTRDWCANRWERGGPVREGRMVPAHAWSPAPEDSVAVRGGGYAGKASSSRAAARYGSPPSATFTNLGVRLAFSWTVRD